MTLGKTAIMFQKKKVYSVSAASSVQKSTENILPQGSVEALDKCEVKKCTFNYKPFLGLFYTLVTSVFITFSSVFVKQLTYISPGQLSMVRNTGIWVASLPIAVYKTKNVIGAGKLKWVLVFRAFLTATGLYLYLTAFRYLPMSEAAVIISSMPAVTTLLAHLYLKEPCGLVQGLALMVTFCGVLLSIRLPELISAKRTAQMDSSYYGGLASAVGCVFTLSISFVAMRKMKDIHFSTQLLYTGIIGMLENGAINMVTAGFTIPNCGWDIISIMLIGVFGFMGHCTMTLAIQTEAVGIVAVMKSSLDIMVAMVFQVIFFNVKPDVYNICGAFLVIASVSTIGLKKWLLSLPEKSELRKKFKYLLM